MEGTTSEVVADDLERIGNGFEDTQRRMAGMQWIVGTGFALIMILVSLLQLFG